MASFVSCFQTWAPVAASRQWTVPPRSPTYSSPSLDDGRAHHATDLARRPEEPALGDVSLAVGADRVKQRRAVAVRRVLPHGDEDAAVGEDRRSDDRAAREDAGARKPAGVFRVAVESPDFAARRRVVGAQPAIAAAEEHLRAPVDVGRHGAGPLAVQHLLARRRWRARPLRPSACRPRSDSGRAAMGRACGLRSGRSRC